MGIRKYLFAVVVALGLAGMPVIGNYYAAAQEEQQFEPDVVKVYGKTVKVQPFQMSQTSFTWRDVKDSLPEEITQVPETPMTYQEVFDKVSEWVEKTQWQYEAELDRITKLELKKEHGDKEYTELDYDIMHKHFSDKFHIPGGEKVSPSTQRVHDRNLACMYLKEMLREAFGYGEARM